MREGKAIGTVRRVQEGEGRKSTIISDYINALHQFLETRYTKATLF